MNDAADKPLAVFGKYESRDEAVLDKPNQTHTHHCFQSVRNFEINKSDPAY